MVCFGTPNVSVLCPSRNLFRRRRGAKCQFAPMQLAEVDCFYFGWNHDLDWKFLEKNCQSQDVVIGKRERFNRKLPSLSTHVDEREGAFSEWTTCTVFAI